MTVESNKAIALVLVLFWFLIGCIKWWEITLFIQQNFFYEHQKSLYQSETIEVLVLVLLANEIDE